MKRLALGMTIALMVAACNSSMPTSTGPPDPDTGAIYAVALRELVMVDNTFGGDGNPFSELLVQTSLDPAAGSSPEAVEIEVRPLNDQERRAIEDALTPLAPVRWIDDPAEWRTDDLMPVVEGSAILGVGPISFDGTRTALVPMSMWCGGLCGTWFTYRVELAEDGWVVSGIEGPIAIS